MLQSAFFTDFLIISQSRKVQYLSYLMHAVAGSEPHCGWSCIWSPETDHTFSLSTNAK